MCYTTTRCQSKLDSVLWACASIVKTHAKGMNLNTSAPQMHFLAQTSHTHSLDCGKNHEMPDKMPSRSSALKM